MEPVGYILFAVAAVFYLRTWKYIHRLVVDVNNQSPARQFTTMGWWKNRYEAWRLHSQLYPASAVRKQIVWSVALTFLMMLGLMFVQVRSFMAAHPQSFPR
jgi:hypothetical protein